MLFPKRWALFAALTTAGTMFTGLYCAQSHAEQTANQAKPERHKVDKSPLSVTISVQPRPVYKDGGFYVSLCVTNTSSTTQRLGLWNCSWEKHWRSNSSLVGRADGKACLANSVDVVELHRGQKYQRTFRMQVIRGQVKSPVSFQMGFTPYDVKPFKADKDDYHHSTRWGGFDVPTPYKGKKTYWSNVVTLN